MDTCKFIGIFYNITILFLHSHLNLSFFILFIYLGILYSNKTQLYRFGTYFRSVKVLNNGFIYT